MRLILLEKDDYIMHAADLADEIYERRLYVKKNGEKAKYTQVRARCGKYHKIFEALPGNRIKLKSEN
jgi:antitoxin Phd